jgi:L-iditol 2-dehydrogenase
VGVCGSDLQYYAHGRIGELQLPGGHILGHEVAAVVEAFARAETRSPDFLKTVITL